MGLSRILDYIRAAQLAMGPPGALWVALERGVLDAFLFVVILLAWAFSIQVVGATGHAVGRELANRIHRVPPRPL